MKAIIRFFKEIVDCAKTGRRKYFWHNLSCRYDWIWAIKYCLLREGKASDLPKAIVSPAFAKQMRADACNQMLKRNQEFVAVYNEHNDHTFGDGISHFLGECEGLEAHCPFCVDEWAKHSSNQCDDECPMCDWAAKGYVYNQTTGRWVKSEVKS